MMNVIKNTLPQLLAALFIMVSMSACTVIDNFVDVKRSNLDYKSNKTVKHLDFPPDLTAPEFDDAFILPKKGVTNASSINKAQ